MLNLIFGTPRLLITLCVVILFEGSLFAQQDLPFPFPTQLPAPQTPVPAAQETPPATPATPPPAVETPSANSAEAQAASQVTAKSLDDLKKSVEGATDLSDELKKSTLEIIEQARAELNQESENVLNLKSWQQLTSEIEAARQKAQADITNSLREKPQRFLDLDTLPKLEQALASKQQELVHAQNELSQTDKRIADRTARQKAIKDRLALIPGEVDALNAELTKLAVETENPLNVNARRLRVLAHLKKLASEPAALQAEAAYRTAQEAANLIQLAKQDWTAKVARLKEEVTTLQRDVLRKKSSEAKDRASVAKGDAESTDIPEIKEIYLENVNLVEQEISYREKEKRLNEEFARSKVTTDAINDKRKDLENRKLKIGNSKSFGIRLQKERRFLPDIKNVQNEIAERGPEYQDAQINLSEIASQISMLGNLETRITDTARRISSRLITDEDSDERRDLEWQITNQVRNAFSQQQKYLTELQAANDGYINALDELHTQENLLITATQEFQNFINQNILWVPTNSVLTFQAILNDHAGFEQLFSLSSLDVIRKRYRRDALDHIGTYALAGFIWLGIVFTIKRQRTAIRTNGQKASSRLNTSMTPTWTALFWTFVKSLLIPFPLLFLSWRGLNFSGEVQLIARFFYILSIWIWWLEFVINTCRDRGLGVAHFQWPERVNRVIVRQLSTFVTLSTPIIFAVAIMKFRTGEGESLPLERVFSIIFLLLLANCLHWLTSRQSGILKEWIASHPGGWLDRLAGLWNLIGVSLPLFLAGLTIFGYSYASGQLSIRLAQSIMAVFFAIFAKDLCVRWLTLRQRRLAIEHAREVRAALAEAEKNQDDGLPPAKSPPPQEVRTNLVEVSMQTRRLLNTTIVVLLATSMWFIWIDVLPALQRLDDVRIPLLGLSLARVLIAGVSIVIFTTLCRNIPGLLEMLLLERLPIDRSVRYAVGALTSYAIAAIGIYVFGNSLGIKWENVQWLAAALTFGLGFGLQEIFANFISGLIILFEQPVRVGDVVTIDQVTGSVSRIQIRSTTIVDWDCKEYIVPNKDIITGRLLNWTLSNTTNRLTFNVKVPHGTDPLLVREMLLQIAKTQPHVMADPSPVVAFDNFTENGLNFVIRLYLPTMEFRTDTIHQMHVRILQEFAAAKIEIPYPHRELRIIPGKVAVPPELTTAVVAPLPPAPVDNGAPAPATPNTTAPAHSNI
ncbi:mechanosensitive ion channel domain-containing protein [Planctomicrobium sp. SH668]|uniref:mechanosensitive ion channel domain-containing protein n=1 Tax=Planctomicrobium sp. SH668 TaxID=3448126 RepID=UPI003F5C3E15